MKKENTVNILLLIFFVSIGILITQISGADANWDLANYHYYSVYALFGGRIGYDIMPCGIQSYFNPLLDIPFYLLIKYFNDSPRLVTAIQSIYWGIAVFLVYLIAKNIFKPNFSQKKWYIGLAVLIGASGIVSILEAGTTFNDIQISIFVLTAILIIQKNLFNKNSIKRMLCLSLSALILGIATGLKPSTLIFSASIFLTLICLFKNFVNPFKTILIMLCTYIFGYFISNGWWLSLLYSNFQNPFFPFYNDFFKSPYAQNISYADIRHFPKNILQWLFFPFYWGGYNYNNVSIEFANNDIRPIVLYISFFILTIFNFVTIKDDIKFKEELDNKITINFVEFLILFLFFSYIIWLNVSATWRYILPLDYLSGIYISLLLIYFSIYIKNNTITKLTEIILLLTILLTTKYPPLCMTRVDFGNKYFSVPDLKLPDNAKVCILGGWPSQIFIPFQNPKAQFIYLYGEIDYPFIYPVNKKNEIKKIITNPENEIFLLYSDFKPAPVDWNTVKEYLNPDDFECTEKSTTFTLAKYNFCKKNQTKLR